MRAGFRMSYDVDASTRQALGGLGRIEDVRFSPDNSRLALACHDRHSIALADVVLDVESDRPHVTIKDLREYPSPVLVTPHGVDFLDDELLLVGDRDGTVAAFHAPRADGARGTETLTRVVFPQRGDFTSLRAPGSLVAVRSADGRTEVLVCNNEGDTVTRHLLADDPLRVTSNEILLVKGLDFPDSVAVDPERTWIAVSSHDAHVVMVYRWTPSLGPQSVPDHVLRGTMYPHGLTFVDSNHLLVADAGGPFVHHYPLAEGPSRGVRYPAASVRVMTDEAAAHGRTLESCGPKGVALDQHRRILAVTFETDPLSFFDVARIIDGSEVEPFNDASMLAYEMEALERRRRRLDASVRTLMGSRVYRYSKPALELYDRWSRTRPTRRAP